MVSWEINMQVGNLALDIWAYYTGSPALSIDFRLVLLPTTIEWARRKVVVKHSIKSNYQRPLWINMNVFRVWDYPNMPTVSKITDFVLHWFMDLQFATITITDHRSALPSLMTFRWLNISRIPDRNILVISFSVEFSSTKGDSLMGSFTRYPFQHKNICLLPNMNVKLLGTLALTKRNSDVLTLSTNVLDQISKASPRVFFTG